MIRIILFLLIISLSTTLSASISKDVNDFFDGLGMASNTTAPNAYQGQRAGYYSLGSIYARNSVRNVQIVQVDLPSANAGCSGIDIFAGGFSYVNRDEIIKMMRNILNSSKAFAFKLALAEVTPIIKNVLGDVQGIANDINKMNINSCETAEALVGSIWPKTRAAQQQVCQDIGSNTGIFNDWAAARQGCSTRDFDSTMEAGSKDSKYKNLILDNGNIVWKALQANNFVSNDVQLSELLMSLSGTIIIKKQGNTDGGSTNFEVLQSLAKDKSLYKAILYGDNAKIYKCDEEKKCLNPPKSLQTITVQKKDALVNKVRTLLKNISDKIIQDVPLNEKEQGLIQATRIPIYKILNVQAAFQKDTNILDIESYSDVIATDILFQYLQENIDIVRTASHALQLPADLMNLFNQGIDIALNDIREEERNAQAKISMTMHLIEETQVIEKMLAGQLSSQLGNSLSWAKSLR